MMEEKKGVAYATLSYIVWGLLPIYWKLLAGIDPITILYYRIIGTALFSFFLGWWATGLTRFLDRSFFTRNRILTMLAAGLLISMNWGIYIWAVNNNQIVQASLGYYINPLFTYLFGILFFHEKANKRKTIALLISVAGVAYMVIGYAGFPVVSITLPLLFASYGAVKKKLRFHAVHGLFFETIYLVPFAALAILFQEQKGAGLIGNASPVQWSAIAMVGLVTAVPLMLFAAGANRLNYTTLGMIQYLSPTITLLLGVFAYGESFTTTTMITFVCIWSGVLLYTLDGISQKKGNATGD